MSNIDPLLSSTPPIEQVNIHSPGPSLVVDDEEQSEEGREAKN